MIVNGMQINIHMDHLQKEWYWVIAMFLFFLERDVMVDIVMLVLYFFGKLIF